MVHYKFLLVHGSDLEDIAAAYLLKLKLAERRKHTDQLTGAIWPMRELALSDWACSEFLGYELWWVGPSPTAEWLEQQVAVVFDKIHILDWSLSSEGAQALAKANFSDKLEINMDDNAGSNIAIVKDLFTFTNLPWWEKFIDPLSQEPDAGMIRRAILSCTPKSLGFKTFDKLTRAGNKAECYQRGLEKTYTDLAIVVPAYVALSKRVLLENDDGFAAAVTYLSPDFGKDDIGQAAFKDRILTLMLDMHQNCQISLLVQGNQVTPMMRNEEATSRFAEYLELDAEQPLSDFIIFPEASVLGMAKAWKVYRRRLLASSSDSEDGCPAEDTGKINSEEAPPAASE